MNIYKFDITSTIELTSSRLVNIADETSLADAINEILSINTFVVEKGKIVALWGDILRIAREIALLSYTYDEVATMRDDQVINIAFGGYTINEVDDL